MTSADADERTGGLLRWQRRHYDAGHRDRVNLVLHLITVPMFQLGTVALLATPWLGWTALSGLGAMVTAVVAQGRGHRRESTAPLPFRGPLDVVARLFAEQWITFPRWAVGGGVARAWREASTPRSG
jgi:hypothetical protein